MSWREDANLGNATIAGLFKLDKTTIGADKVLHDGDFAASRIELGSGVDITEWTPTPGCLYVIECPDSTANATVTLSTGITWDGTNDLATFADDGDAVIVYAMTATRLVVINNLGTVAFT